MKRFSLTRKFLSRLTWVAALVMVPTGAFAQVPGGVGGSSAMNYAMVKLFGSNTAFTCRAEFRVLDSHQKESDNMPMTYTFLDGNTRMDIDMNQLKSTEIPPQLLTTLKQLNMDQTVVITLPNKKLSLSIYPKLKSYAEIAMTPEEAAAAVRSYKIDRTTVGKEAIDGHACEQAKVTLTAEGGKGEKTEAKVWNATDLKGFPVQIQMADQTSTVVIKFKDVKFGKPDPAQFEAPAGMTKFNSAEALMNHLLGTAAGGAK